MSNVAAVTDQNWETEVAKSPLPVLVDFHATWCGPCKVLAPVVDEIAGDMKGKVKVVKCDVDEAQDTASSLGIMSVPTLVLLDYRSVLPRHKKRQCSGTFYRPHRPV